MGASDLGCLMHAIPWAINSTEGLMMRNSELVKAVVVGFCEYYSKLRLVEFRSQTYAKIWNLGCMVCETYSVQLNSLVS